MLRWQRSRARAGRAPARSWRPRRRGARNPAHARASRRACAMLIDSDCGVIREGAKRSERGSTGAAELPLTPDRVLPQDGLDPYRPFVDLAQAGLYGSYFITQDPHVTTHVIAQDLHVIADP